MKNQGNLVKLKVNDCAVPLDAEGRGLAATFSALTTKDIMDLSFDDEHLIVSRKNARGWEWINFHGDTDVHWRSSGFLSREKAWATVKAFYERSEDWMLFSDSVERPRDEVLPPLLKCYICHSVVSDSFGECPFCGGVFDTPEKNETRKPAVKPHAESPAYSSLKIPSFLSGENDRQTSSDQPRLNFDAIEDSGGKKAKWFVACFLTFSFLYTGNFLLTEHKRAKLEKERKTQYEAEVRKKEEAAYDARVKAYRIERDSKRNSETPYAPSPSSSYQPTSSSYRPAMGSALKVGARLYDKATHRYVGNIVSITSSGDVEVADLKKAEFKPDRVSVYGITYSRSYVKENFVTE